MAFLETAATCPEVPNCSSSSAERERERTTVGLVGDHREDAFLAAFESGNILREPNYSSGRASGGARVEERGEGVEQEEAREIVMVSGNVERIQIPRISLSLFVIRSMKLQLPANRRFYEPAKMTTTTMTRTTRRKKW